MKYSYFYFFAIHINLKESFIMYTKDQLYQSNVLFFWFGNLLIAKYSCWKRWQILVWLLQFFMFKFPVYNSIFLFSFFNFHAWFSCLIVILWLLLERWLVIKPPLPKVTFSTPYVYFLVIYNYPFCFVNYCISFANSIIYVIICIHDQFFTILIFIPYNQYIFSIFSLPVI